MLETPNYITSIVWINCWKCIQNCLHPKLFANELFNSVHTRCIVKKSGFTRGVCKNRGFIKFKGFRVEFLESRRSWENQKPPENRQKSGLFWPSPFTMRLVCTLLNYVIIVCPMVCVFWIRSVIQVAQEVARRSQGPNIPSAEFHKIILKDRRPGLSRGGFQNLPNARGGELAQKVAPRRLELFTPTLAIFYRISGERGQFQGPLEIQKFHPPPFNFQRFEPPYRICVK